MAYIHTYIHEYIRTHLHAYIHAYIHAHTHIETHTYTHVHTHIKSSNQKLIKSVKYKTLATLNLSCILYDTYSWNVGQLRLTNCQWPRACADGFVVLAEGLDVFAVRIIAAGRSRLPLHNLSLQKGHCLNSFSEIELRKYGFAFR
jgi:hypothetical protein